MHVALDLANPNGVFTNLDTVSGRVLLVMSSTSPITNITVKLEGESQSQIIPPKNRHDDRRPRPVHEYHKILYNTQIVFPINELANSGHYTLSAGTYEYPFSFKIPFNTTCHNAAPPALPSFPQYIKGSPVTIASHIKAPLPPTLGGFPGLAAIRYYVKVTVNRKEFYKENPRVLQHINFAPIEPPRPSPSPSENYGRRQYQFPILDAAKPKTPKLSKMFSKRSQAGFSSPQVSQSLEKAPLVEVDARLPDPAILTVGQALPLRILVKRLDGGQTLLTLQTLQVELVGHTRVRAGQYQRTEASSWVVTSHSNMDQPLSFPTADAAEAPSSPAGEKAERPAHKPRMLTLDTTRWARPLPANIAPSFRTCNISRWYDLDVRVGIGYGPDQVSRRNQIILPLRLACQVYSGIAPPERLLSRTQAAKPVAKKPLSAAAQHNAAKAQAAPVVGSKADEAGGESSAESSAAPDGAPDGEEPPPSYEDAMAQELDPVSGPRVYEPGPAPEGDDGFPRDQKRRGS